MEQSAKIKLKITSCRGQLLKTYPRQNRPQERYIEVSKNGQLHIDRNAEIGNAIPANIYHGIDYRISIPWTTKAEVTDFIKENKKLFEILVAGMDEKWDGNNYVGTLNDEAKAALDELNYDAFNNQY